MIGRYKHYKGGVYEVTALAKHSETLEELVVYRSLLKASWNTAWARPLTMWNEKVSVDGNLVPRFEPLTQDNCPHEYDACEEPECWLCGHVKTK